MYIISGFTNNQRILEAPERSYPPNIAIKILPLSLRSWGFYGVLQLSLHLMLYILEGCYFEYVSSWTEAKSNDWHIFMATRLGSWRGYQVRINYRYPTNDFTIDQWVTDWNNVTILIVILRFILIKCLLGYFDVFNDMQIF